MQDPLAVQAIQQTQQIVVQTAVMQGMPVPMLSLHITTA